MKRLLLMLALIPGLLLLSSCKKESKEDVTYYLAFYQVGDYVKSENSAITTEIKTLVKETVDSWKKDYKLHWEADPGRSQSAQDAEAVQYMEDAYTSFSKVAADLRKEILKLDSKVVLTLSWTFEALRDKTRLSTSRKVEILNGDQTIK